MMKGLIVTFLTCLACLSGIGDVLWWTIDSDATVSETDQSLYSFLQPLPYSAWDENNPTAPYTEYLAQVVVVNNKGQAITTLPVGWSTGETNPHSGNPMWEFDPDVVVAEIGHPNAGYVGAEWNASKVQHEMLERHLFQVQILQDSSGTDTVLLYSDYVNGTQLMGEHSYTEGTLNPPVETPWVPGVYHLVSPSVPPVPEPSSALFCIFGIGLLMLTRRVD